VTLSPPPTLQDLVRHAANGGIAPGDVRLAFRGNDGELDELTLADTIRDGKAGVFVLVTLREVLERAERGGVDFDPSVPPA
jgi:hypothetical protein